MCSISGIWRFDGQRVSKQEIKAINDATSYRGPDGDGFFLDCNDTIAIAHRRLSILDLSEAGKQPMLSANKKFAITFNGEIFNYLELKSELLKKGHLFSTGTDTEVILAAYMEWGEECLFRFNGMWAFAIWNIEEKTLFLSRDRFGVKPLYYIFLPNQFFSFASEPVAFKHLSGFQRSINDKNVDLSIRHSFYLESVGETIYQGVQKLLPGHNIRIDNKGHFSIKKWWRTEEHLMEVPPTYEEQIEMYRHLFKDACNLRLRSDVPIGIALSGGLDSSSVYCTIQQLYKDKSLYDNQNVNWKNAFIASFPDTRMDERQYADEIVNHYSGIANYIYPKYNDLVDAIIHETKLEEFIYLSPPVVHSIYGEMRAKDVKVSLDGHGADEILFGYPHMVEEYIRSQKNGHLLSNLQHAWADMSGTTYSDAEEMFSKAPATSEAKTTSFRRFIPTGIKNFYRKTVKKTFSNSWHLLDPEYNSNHYPEYAQFDDPNLQICYNEIHLHLPTLLRNWDRASMRHGVEIRMPFLDWRIVTFLMNLPVESKVGGGYSKKIVRDGMAGWMPDSIRLRKNKIGINAPLAEWFNGRLSVFLLDAVNSRSFLQSDIWNGPVIREFVERKTRNKNWTQNEAMRLWPYLNAWILKD